MVSCPRRSISTTWPEALAGTEPVNVTWFRRNPDACETIVIPEPLALTVRVPDCVGGATVVPAAAAIPAPPESSAGCGQAKGRRS